MIPIQLSTLAEITQGELLGADIKVTDITTDTRKITAGCLFVALKGERFDAHDFIEQAQHAGSQALLVSKPVASDLPQLRVKDTRLALGAIAAWVRQQLPARIVGLTGSSGKTSVKEMTAEILKQCGETLYTQGNLNNDLGVPMTLLRLCPEHRYGVIEMGANHQGEIAYTTALVKPEAALINNLAAAHLEGFGSLAGVAEAKGEIFGGLAAGGRAIINGDSHDQERWQGVLADKKLWRFAIEPRAGIDFWASDIDVSAAGTAFQMHTPAGNIDILLPLPGRHNIANALAASALALSVDAPLTAIQQGLRQLKAVPGRLFPIRLSEHQLLLDDSYNANVGSMTAAAQVLAQMPGYRVMVVGDMGELGSDSESCHRQVGLAANQLGINKILSVGDYSHWISAASGAGEHFTTKSQLFARLETLMLEHQDMTILVKGSRSAAMEQIVELLQEKIAC